jgi:hypothetical protein
MSSPGLRVAWIASAVAAWLALTGTVHATICYECQPPPVSGQSHHSSSGYVLTLRALAKIAAVTGGEAAGGGGPRYYYDFAPACLGNGAGGDVLCGPAVRICRRRDRTALLYYVFRGIDPAALGNVGTVCLGAGDFVDRATLSRDVAVELVRRLALAAPAVMTAPAGSTLVRLPTVVWAVNPATGRPDRPAYTVAGTVDDVRVTLTVTGAWSWRLGDRRGVQTLAGAGTPYRAGITPDPRTDPGYYTHHDGATGTGLVTSYRTAGIVAIRLTVTWTPHYTVDYQLGSTELDTATVTYRVVHPLRVGEARAVLIAGPTTATP